MRIVITSSEEVLQIRQFELNRPNKSFPDKTALWHAKQKQCTLLTCDKVLRTEAEFQKIEVHGSIWVLMQLFENLLISRVETVTLLEDLKHINMRLPKNEIDLIISRLK